MNAIISRVQKLLALANDAGATEGESNVALQKAHALLAEHNLSMSDISLKQEAPEAITEEDAFVGENDRWKAVIVQALAEYYFCSAFTSSCIVTKGLRIKFGKKQVIIGTPSNVATVKLMGEYLIENGKRLMKLDCKGKDQTFKHQWFRGYSNRLYNRLTVLAEEARRPKYEATGSGLNLPAIYEDMDQKIESYITSKNIEMKTTAGRSSRASGGYDLGSIRGGQANLSNQLESGNNSRLTG